MSDPHASIDALGPLAAALPLLQEWEPQWAAVSQKVASNPWTDGVLSRKFVELVSLGINVACTNLNADGTRRHLRAALDAGATRAEILMVIKCASVMAIHSCSLAAPHPARGGEGRQRPARRKAPDSDPCLRQDEGDRPMERRLGPILCGRSTWTDDFMAMGANIYGSGVLSAKEVELLSIAFDASFTHMYAPGTRRHIQNALKAGASVEEIFSVLKICVAQGMQASNLGAEILREEIVSRSGSAVL